MRFLKTISVVTFLLCIVWILFYLARTEYKKSLFTIVCTTSILADTVRNVVGQHAQVISLMGPGIDPHVYRPREGDVHTLAGADLVLYHGLHLEGRLATLLESLDRYAPTYAVSDAVLLQQLRCVDGGNVYDPHIWHAIPLWIQVVSYSADRCAQHDPDHARFYYQNADEYIRTLVALHQEIIDVIDQIPYERRILVTAHDAFAYFGATYGLEVIALQGISTESEIGSWDVCKLVDCIIQKKIPALFVETAIPHRTLQAVIDAVQVQGVKVKLGDELYADALGDHNSDADSYVQMIKHNVQALVSGLSLYNF